MFELRVSAIVGLLLLAAGCAMLAMQLHYASTWPSTPIREGGKLVLVVLMILFLAFALALAFDWIAGRAIAHHDAWRRSLTHTPASELARQLRNQPERVALAFVQQAETEGGRTFLKNGRPVPVMDAEAERLYDYRQALIQFLNSWQILGTADNRTMVSAGVISDTGWRSLVGILRRMGLVTSDNGGTRRLVAWHGAYFELRNAVIPLPPTGSPPVVRVPPQEHATHTPQPTRATHGELQA